MKSKYLAALCLLILSCLQMGGCATILNGDHQPVAFSSEPENATVKIDGVAMGKTPCVIPVARKGGDKLVQLELAGHKTVMLELDNQIAAAGFGNILFGGIIGVGIDAASGRAGSYQKSLHIVFEPGAGTINTSSKNNQNSPQTTATKPTASSQSKTDQFSDDKVDQSKFSESTRKWILEKAEE